ncbi:paraquat-inducible protein B [Salmonella enterica subsp. arizonae]|uniref:Paraquat-inducible protein B n=1 Tax=Salmonella enterica subsp. arizonae TaxID=59203 RepID=A0A3S4GW06_SALER|nr:paraquat-inducible protein B [Salmonella enterica subsp. arizonae]
MLLRLSEPGFCFYHYSHQGPEVTLITTNAEGIEGGKTTIKSRSVDVGVVESATLTDDLTHVQIKRGFIPVWKSCCIKTRYFGS